MEEDSYVNTRKSEFQVRKYDGSKVQWNAFVDDIKAAIQARHSTRDKGLKYLFTEWPKNEENPKEYMIDSIFLNVEEPDHLDFDENVTVKQKLVRSKKIETIRGINSVILKMKAKIMEIIQDRVTSSMIKKFNTFDSDPYQAYRWLCITHGRESQGICAKTNSVDIAIDLKMATDVRFSSFYADFVMHMELIGGNDIIAWALLWSQKIIMMGKDKRYPIDL